MSSDGVLQLTSDCDLCDSVDNGQNADVAAFDPGRKSIEVCTVWDADAACAWITAMDAQGAACGVEPRLQIEPEIIAPWLRRSEAVAACRQRCRIAWAPEPVGILALSTAADCIPAGQQQPIAPQVQLPDPVAVRKTRTGASCGERQRSSLQKLGGRATLAGRWGVNHACDAIITRFHPQTNRLQAVIITSSLVIITS